MYAFIWMLCADDNANRLVAIATSPKEGNSMAGFGAVLLRRWFGGVVIS